MEPDGSPVRVSAVDGALAYSLPADDDADGAGGLDVVGTDLADFAGFYRTARDRIARALTLTLGDRDLAVEAVDEAMARAYQRWDRIGTFTDPGGWIYKVGLNWATSMLRRRRRAPIRAVERDVDDVGPVGEPTLVVALRELPVGQRAVVVCRFYLGLSEAETAAALKIRPGTVKSRLHRALQQLEVRLAHLSPKENT